MSKTTNLTYKELLSLVPKNTVIKIEVESNPFGEGGKQELFAFTGRIKKGLSTFGFEQDVLGDGQVDYAWALDWKNYKGKFKLLAIFDEKYNLEKPFVPFKVGQKVRVKENLEDLLCDEDSSNYMDGFLNTAGKTGFIKLVDSYSYIVTVPNIDLYRYSHHQLEPVEEETLELTLEEIAQKFNVSVENLKIKK